MYEFRAAKVPPEYIFDLLPPIRPRGFSISSSPAVRRPSCLTLRRGGELVTVCARSPTPARSTSSSPSSSTRRSSLSRAEASRRRTSPLFLSVRHPPRHLAGTCGLYCTASSLTFHHVGARPAGARLPIRFDTSGQLKLPAGTPPLIMVGPGTGVAPFRALMEERVRAGANGLSLPRAVPSLYHRSPASSSQRTYSSSAAAQSRPTATSARTGTSSSSAGS